MKQALRKWLPVLGFGALVVLTSCAPGANSAQGLPDQTGDIAGFWLGLWHGIIVPVTFIISLFSDTVSPYEVSNNGNWYNFGFFLGACMSLGGGGAGSRKRRG